jgi:hypothetical protein
MKYKSDNEVEIKLNIDQALVIFEFLSELSEGNRNIHNVIESEIIVLSDIQNILESILTQPFHEDYLDSISCARLRIEKSK